MDTQGVRVRSDRAGSWSPFLVLLKFLGPVLGSMLFQLPVLTLTLTCSRAPSVSRDICTCCLGLASACVVNSVVGQQDGLGIYAHHCLLLLTTCGEPC